MGSFTSHRINYEELRDGAYGFSSLSEKTRKSNHLQMSLQRQHFLLSYLKTLTKVGLRDAFIGCLQIPTIDGRVLSVQLNEVIQPGAQKRIPGEGLPLPKYPGKRGDMIVTFDVEMPTNLSMEQRRHLANLV